MINQANNLPIGSELMNYSLEPGALNNRVVLISGATGGLGTQLSIACAKAGATVVMISKTVKKLEALYDVIAAMQGAAQPAIIALDQSEAPEADYTDLTKVLNSEFGKLDALVHTAADVGVMSPLTQISQKDWARVMSVNLTSARLLTNACLPLLQQSDNASISYTIDEKNSAYWGAYGVSKMALLSLASMVHDETENQLATDGTPLIAVNAIDPGPMRTPLRRKAFPGELESESPTPETKLGAFLSLIARDDRQRNGAYLKHA